MKYFSIGMRMGAGTLCKVPASVCTSESTAGRVEVGTGAEWAFGLFFFFLYCEICQKRMLGCITKDNLRSQALANLANSRQPRRT